MTEFPTGALLSSTISFGTRMRGEMQQVQLSQHRGVGGNLDGLDLTAALLSDLVQEHPRQMGALKT